MGKQHKLLRIYIIFSLVVFFLVFISVLLVDHYNSKHYYETDYNYSQIYIYKTTTYNVNDVSFDIFAKKLTQMISQDSSACYGRKRKHYTSLQYSKEKCLFETRLSRTGKKHLGPRRIDITFLIPYNTDQINLAGNFFKPGYYKNDSYKYVYNKIEYNITIIDTSPITILLPRGEDIDEQQLICELNDYVENHYLNKICKYRKNNFLNWYFFCIKWSFYNFYYVILWWFIIAFIIYIIERSIKRRRLRKLEEDRFFGIID